MDSLVQFLVEEDVEEQFVRVRNRQLRDASNIFDLPEAEFIANFRMNRECYREILQEIVPRIKARYFVTAIPVELKFAVFLRFLACGSYQKCLANSCLAVMSQKTLSKVISECLDIFEEYFCAKWISIEMTDEKESEIKEHFFSKYNIPGVIGCVDGTHIKISSPAQDLRHLYYNRKGYYSINAMIICDHKMVVRYVDATHPGANHDAYVWRLSAANNYLQKAYDNGKRNTWILGDSDYQLLPYLMTPYRSPVRQHEFIFNERQCKARNVIGRCFGVLKNRFGCLIGERYYTSKETTKIINACCAIHNACIFYKNEWPTMEAETVPDFEIIHPRTELAVGIRERLALSISKVG